MQLRELLSGEGGSSGAAGDAVVTGLTADSRAAEPGHVFFALAGAKTDGARFAEQAIGAGAVAVVSDHLPPGGKIIRVANARRALALAAARFYPHQPDTIVAVTGTSGKTSVAAFTQQIWAHAGHLAASLGTVGIVTPAREVYGSLTTPDPVALHRAIDELAVQDKITHLVVEASSHGLHQHRLDGLRIAAGAFTNLSRDHMDYHPTVEDYLAAKLRLFTDLVQPGGAAVIAADHDESARAIAAAQSRGLRVMTVGRAGQSDGEGITLRDTRIEGLSQRIELRHQGRDFTLMLPLVGSFQIENALVAAGLAIVTGSDARRVFCTLEDLHGAPGRLERVGERNGAPIFVDYAHKPDALAKALDALRPFAHRRLVVVFGAGGDRDAGKRPLMGEIAAAKADDVIVTDDNPRSEDPQKIRSAILAAAPRAREIGDRAMAIRTAVDALQAGDVLLIAGKGHEKGQIVGTRVLPFSDHDAVAAALAREGRMSVLWTAADMAKAMNAVGFGSLPAGIIGLSIDTRSITPGEAFFAIKGDVHDGHDFVAQALKAGAGLAVVAKARRGQFAADAPLLAVDDVLEGLTALARASRARLTGQVIAVTGSVGKTSTKEALRVALATEGETHASVASFNNHWGVPLSLARCPASVKYAVFEIGMNHAGEITPLTKLVRPHIAVVTTVEPVHLEFFGTLEAIADAKAEIFLGLEGGVAVLNRDNAQFERLQRAALAAGVSRVVSFGSDAQAQARLIETSLHATCSCVHADILGQDITYKIAVPGRHIVMNSLAVLAAATLAGADLAAGALALAQMTPPPGRGARLPLQLPGGAGLLIDESYNANPASMRAALDVLGRAKLAAKGRRIAVLGDMLELGSAGPDLHRSLAAAIEANAIDVVFCSGPLMRNLFDALPPARRGGYAVSAAELEPQVTGAVHSGDTIMVKGSAGSKMKIIVAALMRSFPDKAALDDVTA